jgi:PKD repeat protein
MAVFNQDAADWTDGHPRSVKLLVYSAPSLSSALSSDWTDECSVTLDATKYPDPNVISPSFSPDGTKVLWADSDGVKVASVADVAKDGSGNCTSVSPATLIPGGSEPFYGAGNVARGAANPNQPGATPAAALLAQFTVVPKHPRARHKIVFDAGKSTAAKSYAWSFGDGKKGKGRRVKHAYRKAKTYKVTLTVTDAAGKHAKVTHKVKVRR